MVGPGRVAAPCGCTGGVTGSPFGRMRASRRGSVRGGQIRWLAAPGGRLIEVPEGLLVPGFVVEVDRRAHRGCERRPARGESEAFEDLAGHLRLAGAAPCGSGPREPGEPSRPRALDSRLLPLLPTRPLHSPRTHCAQLPTAGDCSTLKRERRVRFPPPPPASHREESADSSRCLASLAHLTEPHVLSACRDPERLAGRRQFRSSSLEYFVPLIITSAATPLSVS